MRAVRQRINSISRGSISRLRCWQASRDTQAPDNVIHREVIRRMREQPWANSYFTVVDVRDGVVRFSGFAGDGHVERGLRALAEEVQGVKEVVFTTEPIPPHSAQ